MYTGVSVSSDKERLDETEDFSRFGDGDISSSLETDLCLSISDFLPSFKENIGK